MNATEGEMAQLATEFVEELRKVTDIKVEMIDERLTTTQAERVLVEEANVSREKRKGLRDKLAATFILQTYLDIHSNSL
jgi:putative Holliday junction resolvase